MPMLLDQLGLTSLRRPPSDNLPAYRHGRKPHQRSLIWFSHMQYDEVTSKWVGQVHISLEATRRDT